MSDKLNEITEGSFLRVNEEGKAYWGQPEGGGGVPKPLTYDYMPEGYPSKSVGTVTLVEEQEVTFTASDGLMAATLSVGSELADGDKLTVVWDGVSYNTVVTIIRGKFPAFGNLGLIELGEAADYPFVYLDSGNGNTLWATSDAASSHTIKVTTIGTNYQTIDVNMLPKAGENYGVVKKDEIVTAYVFPGITAPQLQMNKAVDDFAAGKAKITWGGATVLLAERSSDTEVIICLSSDPVNIYKYTANEVTHEYNIHASSECVSSELHIEKMYLKKQGDLSSKILVGPIVGVYNDYNDEYIKYGTTRIYEDGIAIKSNGSSKMFKITVDDSGTLSAVQV